MITALLIVLILVQAAAIGCLIYFRVVPRLPPPFIAAIVGTPEHLHACETCGTYLPETTLKTHDGHWRCAAHKQAS